MLWSDPSIVSRAYITSWLYFAGRTHLLPWQHGPLCVTDPDVRQNSVAVRWEGRVRGVPAGILVRRATTTAFSDQSRS